MKRKYLPIIVTLLVLLVLTLTSCSGLFKGPPSATTPKPSTTANATKTPTGSVVAGPSINDLQALKEQVNTIQLQVGQLNSSIAGVQSNTEWKQAVAAIQKSVTDMQTTLNNIGTAQAQLKTQFDALVVKYDKLKLMYDEMDGRLSNMSVAIGTKSQLINNLEVIFLVNNQYVSSKASGVATIPSSIGYADLSVKLVNGGTKAITKIDVVGTFTFNFNMSILAAGYPKVVDQISQMNYITNVAKDNILTYEVYVSQGNYIALPSKGSLTLRPKVLVQVPPTGGSLTGTVTMTITSITYDVVN